jgi:hypothetical protein
MKTIELEFEDLPVYPNGLAHFEQCQCVKPELGRTKIDGEWFPVCAGCGSLIVFRIKGMQH